MNVNESGQMSAGKQVPANESGQMRAGKHERGWVSANEGGGAAGPPSALLFIYSVFHCEMATVSQYPLSQYYILMIIIFFIINICGFCETPPGHHANTGMVWKLLTHSIPVPNPSAWCCHICGIHVHVPGCSVGCDACGGCCVHFGCCACQGCSHGCAVYVSNGTQARTGSDAGGQISVTYTPP